MDLLRYRINPDTGQEGLDRFPCVPILRRIEIAMTTAWDRQ